MAYLGSWKIDDNLTFPANTHTASTGAVTDADAVPAYRVYEDETATPLLTGNMALLDDANTTGFYSEQIALTAANGFEKGKSYTIHISAAVGSITGTMSHTFQIEAEVDANVVSGNVDVTSISGSAAVADRFEAWLGGFLTGAVEEGSGPTTTVFQTNSSEATDDHFKNMIIAFTGGALLGQARRVSAYTGSTGTFTVEPALTEAPAAADTWIIFPMVVSGIDANGRVNVGRWLDSAVTLSTGNLPDMNVAEISDDSTAADNAELFFDGTGYAGGTTKLGVNVTQWLGNAVTQINLTNVEKSVSNTSVSDYRGDYWSLPFTSLGTMTGYTDVWLTLKEKESDTDANAIATVSYTVGLEVLNKSSSGLTAANGTITVTDASAGDITVTLKASDTAQIAPRDYLFDIQWKNASGNPFTLAKGTFTVKGDVQRATT